MTLLFRFGYARRVTETPEHPDFIGPYRVIRAVARGGMAAVYEVVEPESGRRIALKLLERRFRGHQRFGREYRALTRLDHPNIVRVYRFGVAADGTPFLTMELLDGVPAQVHAKRCGRPGTPERVRDAVRIIGEVARALSYLHSRGIVHRDLKSSNVLVLRDGRVKVLDFGTARLAEAVEAITRHGEFVGTYAYAAPEQFSGSGVDARTDLYSLGVLFYRLLTGHRPFDSDDPEELRRMHAHEVPLEPCARVPGIPAEVGAVVMHLLRKIPDERPVSAAWVVNALERHSGDRPRDVGLPTLEVAGRNATLGRVRDWLSDPDHVVGSSMVLAGPLGVGASDLLRPVLEDAEAAGWAVVRTALSSVPGIRGLAGLVRGIARWGGVRADPELGFVLAAVSRTPDPALPSAETPERLVRVLKRAFARKQSPVLLLVRGLDAAPSDVLSLLAQVVGCGAAVAMVGVVSADSTTVRQRLTEKLPAPRFESLDPLDYLACFRLIGSVLGLRSPPPRLVGRVFAATGGRPGFVVDVVHAMQSEGLATAEVATQPVDRSGGRVPLPESVAEAIRGQLRAQSTQTLQVLQVLSLAGGPVRLPVIANVLGVTSDELVLLLDELQRASLVSSLADGGVWTLPFDLLGEVVRAGLRCTSRDVLVRRLAAAMIYSPASAGIVRLCLEAGRLADASRAAVVWGQAELERGHPDLVAPVVGRVVHAWQGTDGQKGCPGPLLMLQAAARVDLDPGGLRTAELLRAVRARPDVPQAASAFLLARHLRWLPALGPAEQQLDEAADLARAADDLHTLVGVACARAESLLLAGRFAQARQVLSDVESNTRHRQERTHRLKVALLRARSHVAEGKILEAESVLGTIPVDARWLGPREAGLIAAVRASVAGLAGRWTHALIDVLNPALARIRQTGDPVCHALLLAEAIAGRIALYQLGEARDLVEESRVAGLRGLPWFRARRARFDGLLCEQSGALEDAITSLRRAVDISARFGLRVEETASRSLLGRTLMRAGRVDEAMRALDAADVLASDLESGVHLEEARVCRVEALLMPPARAVRPLHEVEASAHELCRSQQPRVRVRACVALIEAGNLRTQERAAVVSTARDTLDVLDQLLEGEAKAAFQVHPWRVTVERCAQPPSIGSQRH